MREILTISRMETLTTCPRKDYYKNELGLRPEIDHERLIFGKAWHKALECKMKGMSKEQSLEAALTCNEMDEVTVAKISAMLAGYYHYYGEKTNGETHPELVFRYPIKGSLTFDASGRIDCILKQEKKTFLMEYKTTSEDLSNDSQYWSRLKYNTQLYQYYLGAKHLGYDIDYVLYDVVRKPTINPRASVPEVDEHWRKIVIDTNGERVYKKNGEPKESADTNKGQTLKTRQESCDEYFERLYQDILERPEFYFVTKEVPILIQDLETFIDQRIEIGKQILYYRNRFNKVGVAGFPRNVKFWTCKNCEYQSFCLNNIEVDINNPPIGFKIGKLNEELEDEERK